MQGAGVTEAEIGWDGGRWWSEELTEGKKKVPKSQQKCLRLYKKQLVVVVVGDYQLLLENSCSMKSKLQIL